MDPRLLESYLIQIAVQQGAIPPEKGESLLQEANGYATPRERLIEKEGLVPEYLDGLVRKHSLAIGRKLDASFAIEAQRQGFAAKPVMDDALKASQGFAAGFDAFVIEKKILTPDQVRQVRGTVDREIIVCPVCLTIYRNAKKLQLPEIQCAKCKARFSPISELAGPPTQATIAEPKVELGDSKLPERIGDYRILSELGRGGMGIVYEAEQVSLKRKVALKVAPAGLSLNAGAVERFHREAESLAKIQHPNIVQVFGSSRQGDFHFYAMELVKGRLLQEMLRETRADPRLAAEMIRQIAEALQAAHDAKVIHRDVKPSNIIVDEKKQAHLMDFGVARTTEDVGLTQEGYAVGTPAYMSPEQAGGKRSLVGPLTDVYSLGATLYCATTGHPPYIGQTPEAVLQMVVSRDPISPKKWNGDLPVDLETIILHSMEREPVSRYQSASAMAADLKRYLDGEPIEARPIPTVERWVRTVRRNRLLIGVGAAASLIGVIVALIAIFSTKKQRQEAQIAQTEAQQVKQESAAAVQKKEEEKKQVEEESKKKEDQARRDKEAADARTREEADRRKEAERKQEEAALKAKDDARKAEEEQKKALAEEHEKQVQAALEKERAAVQSARSAAQTHLGQITAGNAMMKMQRMDWRGQVTQYTLLIDQYNQIEAWLERVTDPELKKRLADDPGFKTLTDLSAEKTAAKISLLNARIEAVWITFWHDQHEAQGLKELEDILKESPENPAATSMKGKLLYFQKKVADAEKQFNAVLERSPQFDRAHMGLARIAIDKKDWKSAQSHLASAESVSPGMPELEVLRTRYHFDKGEYDKVVEVAANKRMGWDRTGEGTIYLAKAYLGLKKPKDAVDALAVWVGWIKKANVSMMQGMSEDPDPVRKEREYQMWMTYAEANLAVGRKEDAQDAAAKALEIKPNDSAAKKLLDKSKK